jgi:hypothetical protein
VYILNLNLIFNLIFISALCRVFLTADAGGTGKQSGWNVTTVIPVQQASDGSYKNYTIIYFVMEKVFPCIMYPPNDQVLFYDILVQYNNQTVTPTWSTSYYDDNCNCRAHIVNATSIQITWDSTAR